MLHIYLTYVYNTYIHTYILTIYIFFYVGIPFYPRAWGSLMVKALR